MRAPRGKWRGIAIVRLAWACTFVSVFSCSKSGTNYGKLSCLDGWPVSVTQPTAEAALSTTPAVLWRTPLTPGAFPSHPGIALSGNSVVASSGASVFMIDIKTGAILSSGSTRPDPSNYGLGSPSVDGNGIVYAESAVALYAFGPDGKLNWTYALAGQSVTSEPSSGQNTPSVAASSAVLAPSGAYEQAFDLTGRQLWSTSGLGASVAAGHWGLGYDGAASYLLDLRTGQPSGRLQALNGHDVISVVPLGGRGIVAVDRNNNDGLNFLLVDPCGKQVWSLAVPGGKTCFTPLFVVGEQDVLYMQIDSCDSSSSSPQILGITPDGKIAAGPTPRVEVPWLAGADGTLYAADLFGKNGIPQTRIVALSPSLQEIWHLDVDAGPGPYATAVLSNDGVLYTQSATGILAIQTTSPGLARSSWPTYRHDNGATNWGGGQF
jgi:PQQ-like domain